VLRIRGAQEQPSRTETSPPILPIAALRPAAAVAAFPHFVHHPSTLPIVWWADVTTDRALTTT
jgi:hypothetical protein